MIDWRSKAKTLARGHRQPSRSIAPIAEFVWPRARLTKTGRFRYDLCQAHEVTTKFSSDPEIPTRQ